MDSKHSSLELSLLCQATFPDAIGWKCRLVLQIRLQKPAMLRQLVELIMPSSILAALESTTTLPSIALALPE